MAEETIYLCNFRVSVDGEWLCLKELADVHFDMTSSIMTSSIMTSSFTSVVSEDGQCASSSIASLYTSEPSGFKLEKGGRGGGGVGRLGVSHKHSVCV